MNQCKGVYIEECDFAIATDNAIDAVAVQVGAQVMLASLRHRSKCKGRLCSTRA